MNTAGINRINDLTLIFTTMNELFQKELPSNFDDTLLVGKVMRRLEGRVNPSLIREAIAFIHNGAAQPTPRAWTVIPNEETRQVPEVHGWRDLH